MQNIEPFLVGAAFWIFIGAAAGRYFIASGGEIPVSVLGPSAKQQRTPTSGEALLPRLGHRSFLAEELMNNELDPSLARLFAQARKRLTMTHSWRMAAALRLVGDSC